MGSSDKASRRAAVPMLLPVWGYNSNENSDTDTSQNSSPGDLINLIGQLASPQKQNPVRILRPKYGVIDNAYLSLQLQVNSSPGDDGTAIWIGRGKFDSTAPGTERMVTVTEADIKADHARAFGRSTPFYPYYSNDVYFLDRLEITDLIPKSAADGADYYREYAFVIVIMFDGFAPDGPNSPKGYTLAPYQLWEFKIEASAGWEV